MIHYIPNTNNKYSITEKGVVTMHYKNYISSIIKCKIILSSHINKRNDKIVSINRIPWSIERLIFCTYGYTLCKKCNSKIYKTVKTKQCDSCNKDWHNVNNKFQRDNITKLFTSIAYRIPVNKVTNDLNNIHILNEKIKRLIKSKQNGLQTR